MFVIEEIFVEDKHLAQVLTLLSGLVLDMKAPRVVVNAVAKKGKIKQASPETTSKDRFLELVKKKYKQSDVVSMEDLKDLIVEIGGAPTGSTYYAAALLDSGTATRRGRGQYVIN